jgi:predicted nucleic-acid-binding protein
MIKKPDCYIPDYALIPLVHALENSHYFKRNSSYNEFVKKYCEENAITYII